MHRACAGCHSDLNVPPFAKDIIERRQNDGNPPEQPKAPTPRQCDREPLGTMCFNCKCDVKLGHRRAGKRVF